MEDGGGRSAHARAAAAAAKAKKKKEKNDANTSREQPRHPVPFAQIPGLTDALLERLEALGATEPSFMHLFARWVEPALINQLIVFFSHNKLALFNQLIVFFSHNKTAPANLKTDQRMCR